MMRRFVSILSGLEEQRTSRLDGCSFDTMAKFFVNRDELKEEQNELELKIMYRVWNF